VFLRLRDDVDAKDVESPGDARIGAAGGQCCSRPGRRRHRTTRAGALKISEILAQLEKPEKRLLARVRARTASASRISTACTGRRSGAEAARADEARPAALFRPRVAFIVPHLADRPLTMIRMPDGIGGQRFYQKHWEQERPPVRGDDHRVLGSQGREPRVPAVQQPADAPLARAVRHARISRLAFAREAGPDCAGSGTDYASSLAALEESVLNYPDYVVFDIDPYIYSGKEAPGAEPELNTVAFEKGKEVAFRLRELLASMSLEAIVKTSGKTGLHVFVPIRRTIDFDAARHVSELVGRHLMRRHPKDITLEWSVPKRTGKIFMDYNMNVRGKTLNVAYSPRGEPGAPVSIPLSWEELERAHPLDFRITNVPERLAQTGDRWGEALQRKQSLESVLERAKA
jgi:bifunctional non-homologous end joining protein LigD